MPGDRRAARVTSFGQYRFLAIRELSDVPVLVLGDNGNEADEVKALRAGADDFLFKPFGKAEIHARIEALLRRPRQEDEPEFLTGFLPNPGRIPTRCVEPGRSP